MGGEQALKLGESGVGFAGARILQSQRIAREGVVGIGIENFFQRRHAAFVGHGYCLLFFEAMIQE